MRVSSATSPSSSGTFRSARSSTTLPVNWAVRTERGSLKVLPAASRAAGGAAQGGTSRFPRTPLPVRARARSQELADEIDQPARVAPLVVVPAEDLDHVAA